MDEFGVRDGGVGDGVHVGLVVDVVAGVGEGRVGDQGGGRMGRKSHLFGGLDAGAINGGIDE